jgi:hypothetical protein
MLGAIGAASIEALFDEIPPALKTGELPGMCPTACRKWRWRG